MNQRATLTTRLRMRLVAVPSPLLSVVALLFLRPALSSSSSSSLPALRIHPTSFVPPPPSKALAASCSVGNTRINPSACGGDVHSQQMQLAHLPRPSSSGPLGVGRSDVESDDGVSTVSANDHPPRPGRGRGLSPLISEIETIEDFLDFTSVGSGGHNDSADEDDDEDDERLSVIKFYAPFCKSCARFGLRYRKLAFEEGDRVDAAGNVVRSGRVRFAEADITVAPRLCRALGIRSLPYVHMYKKKVGNVAQFACGPARFGMVIDKVNEFADMTTEEATQKKALLNMEGSVLPDEIITDLQEDHVRGVGRTKVRPSFVHFWGSVGTRIKSTIRRRDRTTTSPTTVPSTSIPSKANKSGLRPPPSHAPHRRRLSRSSSATGAAATYAALSMLNFMTPGSVCAGSALMTVARGDGDDSGAMPAAEVVRVADRGVGGKRVLACATPPRFTSRGGANAVVDEGGAVTAGQREGRSARVKVAILGTVGATSLTMIRRRSSANDDDNSDDDSHENNATVGPRSVGEARFNEIVSTERNVHVKNMDEDVNYGEEDLRGSSIANFEPTSTGSNSGQSRRAMPVSQAAKDRIVANMVKFALEAESCAREERMRQKMSATREGEADVEVEAETCAEKEARQRAVEVPVNNEPEDDKGGEVEQELGGVLTD